MGMRHRPGLRAERGLGGAWPGRSVALCAGLALTGRLVGASAGVSRAAGDPDAAKGIVVEHCVGCHEVPGYGREGLATVEALSFRKLADNP